MYLLFNLYSDDALLKTDQSILFKNISPAPLPTFLGNVLATGKPYRDVHCLQTPSLEATTSSW